jgi:hypothetical protein
MRALVVAQGRGPEPRLRARLAGGHGHGQQADRAAPGAAAVADLGEEAEVAETHAASELEVVVPLHRVAGQRIDLAGIDAAVSKGRHDGFTRQLQLGSVEPTSELGLADTDDGRSVSQCHAVPTLVVGTPLGYCGVRARTTLP